MSRRFTRVSLLLVLMLTSNVWAVGLGDINLDSALNEPLRAEIELLSASPDELADLKVSLASAATFERYGIDRPFYLQNIEFSVVSSGAGGSAVEIRSPSPITEPFLTFLVEATWSSGQLLREYTVLLDPPTYVAPSVQQDPVVEAPRRSTPSDSGRIERQPEPAPVPQESRPAPQPAQPARSVDPAPTTVDPAPTTDEYVAPSEPRVRDESPYDTASGGDLIVQRGETLWGVAARNRSDSRLSINQTMLAIYEANPDAFGGNINLLKTGASLRIPSADEIFQISRSDAFSEVSRQNNEWSGGSGYTAPEPVTRPSLTLVPPDEEPAGTTFDDEAAAYEPLPSREEVIEDRIAELEAANVPNQQSLIEIRDDELATLRQELANIRGEVYEPPVTDAALVDDELIGDLADTDEADDIASDDVVAEDEVVADDTVEDARPSNIVTTRPSSDKGIVDTVIEFLTGFWGIIIAALILVVGGLAWFMRRGGDDAESNDRPWETLDSDEIAAGAIAATTTMQAPVPDDAFVVVEQDSGQHPILEDTVEAPAPVFSATEGPGSGAFGSLEDTFSSETAVNLDQTDPMAEADFHMAYGLYDQAADLINGALDSDPSDKSLMAKLCEIYFVWGNRDAFVDAATRLKMSTGDSENVEWDKIVIMGQQIAADHDLFAGAEVAGATKAVDMSFDDGDEAAGELDMDLGADVGEASDVVDLGADELGSDDDTQQGVDFNFDEPDDQPSAEESLADKSSVDFDLDVTAEAPTIESTMTAETAETAEIPVPTVEASAIEDQFDVFGGGTAELPSLDDESLEESITSSGQDYEATAEINLDDLDLDVDGVSDTEVAALDDLDDSGRNETLSDTRVKEALAELDVSDDDNGKNSTLVAEETGIREGLDLSDMEESPAIFAPDETGQNPMLSAEEELDPTDVGIDDDLLDATGGTQILSETIAVKAAADLSDEISDNDATLVAPDSDDDDATSALSDEAETLLAPLDDDDDNFDLAKTEALPSEAFTGNTDLDLDDLTAALQASEIGDTIEQPQDDATVEQPRPTMPETTAEDPTVSSIAPEDLSDDLHEARTMTEVGTKLDLARAYVDMGDPAGARSILEEVLDEGDDSQKQQAQQLLDSLPS